ncbi:MAG: shikimate kinase [Pseudomonadales bacterium]|jgi:hypothetical protein|nr:shikimate kinase [Pseudomonadales bacterium]
MSDIEGIELVAPERLVRGRWVISIEGMGGGDERDPALVAARVTANLRARGVRPGPASPALIVTQGDPPRPRGLAAITLRVAEALRLERAMIVLDAALDPTHACDADVRGVSARCFYSQLAAVARTLPAAGAHDLLTLIEQEVRSGVERRDRVRASLGMPPLDAACERFARLQELTRGVLGHLADRLLVAHTASDVRPFSVTSFCDVGLENGLVAAADMVPYEPAAP